MKNILTDLVTNSKNRGRIFRGDDTDTDGSYRNVYSVYGDYFIFDGEVDQVD